MSDTPLTQLDYECSAALKAWRNQKAREEGVPAWHVLPNRLLSDLVARRPTSEDDLRPIKGMGPVRMERYGAEILRILGSGSTTVDDGDSPLENSEARTTPGLETCTSTAEPAPSLPYCVVVEYHLTNEARKRLVDELEATACGPLLESLQGALKVAPARVCIRVEAARDAA